MNATKRTENPALRVQRQGASGVYKHQAPMTESVARPDLAHYLQLI